MSIATALGIARTKPLFQVVRDRGLAASYGNARRFVRLGIVTVDGQRVFSEELPVLPNQTVALCSGARVIRPLGQQ